MTAAMAVAQSTAQFGRNGLPVLKVVGNDLGQDGRQEKAMSVGAVDADALAMDGDLGNVVIKCGTHSNRIFGNAAPRNAGWTAQVAPMSSSADRTEPPATLSLSIMVAPIM